MALTRRMLKSMGLNEEQIDTIIDAHTETVDGLKADLSRYKADAEALAGVRKELETAQADLENEKKGSWRVKYDAIKEEYGAYKTDQEKKAAHAAKEAAYRDLLKKAGVSEKRINAVLKVTDVDGLELDENGVVKDAAKVTKSIKDEWSDFIATTQTSGAKTATPPSNGSTAKTKKDILKIKDAGERQKAIAENHELFGF